MIFPKLSSDILGVPSDLKVVVCTLCTPLHDSVNNVLRYHKTPPILYTINNFLMLHNDSKKSAVIDLTALPKVKKKFRFGLAWPDLARQKWNFCFEVNGRCWTSVFVTLYKGQNYGCMRGIAAPETFHNSSTADNVPLRWTNPSGKS